MERRRFLAALAAGSLAGASGCGSEGDRSGVAGPATGGDAGTAGGETGGTATPPGTTGGVRLARQGVPQTVCRERVRADPGIYAVTEPAVGDDWSGVAPDSRYRPVDGTSTDTAENAEGLDDDHTVVGLSGEWGARAYPLGVLWHHEVVNDAPGGTEPVVVTFCPLCNSGLVARRVVDGSPTTFLVSGLLWKAPGIEAAAAAEREGVFGARETGGESSVRNSGNLVMYDRATGSYWSQILATAICGPMRGTDLEVVPSTVTTWAAWRDAHPGTDVLLPPPRSGTVDPGDVDPGPPPRRGE